MTATEVGVLRLATRGSALARAQAAIAAAAIRRSGGPRVELVIVSTIGDREQTAPIDELGGQGWFTAEVDRAVADGRADVAVHSAKDMPTTPADGLEVAAVLERADPRDALVTADRRPLAELAHGARVGSSSARRSALLADVRPDLSCVPMRGNVDSRLRKLDAGEVGALLVAAAGLDRLGLGDRAAERLDPRRFVPAPAQGAIALVTATGSAQALAVAPAGDPATAVAIAAERAVLRALGGGCLLPLGAWARLEAGSLVLSAALGGDDGVRRAEASGDPAHPEELAERVAASLR